MPHVGHAPPGIPVSALPLTRTGVPGTRSGRDDHISPCPSHPTECYGRTLDSNLGQDRPPDD